MVIDQQLKEVRHDQKYWLFLHFTFQSFVTYIGSVNNVFWTLSIKYTLTFKGGTFITDAIVQWL